jgi:hypothetical protein
MGACRTTQFEIEEAEEIEAPVRTTMLPPPPSPRMASIIVEVVGSLRSREIEVANEQWLDPDEVEEIEDDEPALPSFRSSHPTLPSARWVIGQRPAF